ncbi:uncharacterized protein AB675_2625 [Cyphellophora attinorum]|uniref:Transmembrane protein n=1 Tax=Cyphellophora attinorum TaxID=1664694 RepID=A0A0N1P1L2_9EURO|nr:uncharacterized protein AB675_2625 [Phialophora attinorum]KPI45040.1 hypothetical protein AB675_2625 [Phialophora attinorum]
MTRQSTFEQKSRKIEEVENRIKRHWYPVLLAAIAMDLLLLVAFFYIVYEADYYNVSKSGYLWRSCIIIFAPLLLVLLMLFWPYSEEWTKRRDAFSMRKSSRRWRDIVNILNAAACFVFVLAYLLLSAIPKYNAPTWQTSIDVAAVMPVPAIAMIVLENDDLLSPARFANETYDGVPIGLPAFVSSTNVTNNLTYTGPPALYRQQEVLPASIVNLSIDAIVSNSTIVQPTVGTPLQAGIYGTVLLQYDKDVFDARRRNSTGVAPTMILSAFDPRLSLAEVALCSIVQTSLVNAFAQNNFQMTVSQLKDPRSKMVRPTVMDPICERAYHLLETANPPIANYDLRLTSSQTTNGNFSEECVIGQTPDQTCMGGFSLVYSSQFVTTQISVPGKSKQDIWIDCGAIVGAVQFFAWFLFVFFQE